MFCHKCGFELPDGSRFCPNCGTPVPELGTPTAPEGPAQPSEIRPSEEKTELVSERPSRPATRLGRVRRVMIVVTLVFIGLLAVVIFLVYRGAVPPLADWQEPGGREVTATENAALWGDANAALGRFVGEGIKAAGISGPSTREETAQLSQWLNDFHKVVSQLQDVVPPDEQAPMHRALLPIYQDMSSQMESIKEAVLAGDELAADLEWHRLALLVDEAGTLTEMLTLTPEVTPGPGEGADEASLTGTWTIKLWGHFRYWTSVGDIAGEQSGADFGRVFEINVTEDNGILSGSGTDVTRQGYESPVTLEITVIEGSVVTFTVLEKFPMQDVGYVDLLHTFTGKRSHQEITGTFNSAFDHPTDKTGTLHFRVEGEFTVSVLPK